MIRLTKLADYGVALMTHLGRDASGGPKTARSLSEETGLPLPTVSKILKLLAQADLLSSRRGVAGGYSLARATCDITLSQVVSALEGTPALTECLDDDGCDCDMRRTCGLRGKWNRINADLLATLDNYTLERMCATAADSSEG